MKANGSEKPSNPVEVQVAAQVVKPECTINETTIVLKGGSGSKRKPFTVSISSLGVKEITFYVDGKKLKTLTAAQAKNGQFVIKIDPRKLHFGAHTVTAKAVMTEAICPPLARSAKFVRPKPPKIIPKFTG